MKLTKLAGIIALFTLFCCLNRASAQLPAGSTAPDFSVKDIYGKDFRLYDILDSGKIVILEISATWCPPCWAYHASGAMADFYAEHGPQGDNSARVLFVEGDPATGIDCLYGQSSCTSYAPGNYVADTHYPIIDNAAVADLYQISYFPTIFIICPNKKLTEVAATDPETLWEKAKECPVALGKHNAGVFEFKTGTDLYELCGVQMLSPSFQLTNIGDEPLTSATLELRWSDSLLQSLAWQGSLPKYGAKLVQFGSFPLEGPGTMNLRIKDVNAQPFDDDEANNQKNKTFSTAKSFATQQVLLKLRTDAYGEETYWEVRDAAGQVLERGGNELVGPNGGGIIGGFQIGAGAYPDNTLIKDTLNLPADGCYSIHFVDAYGDGFCCDFGNGYYRLFNLTNQNVPVLAGGKFDDYDHRGFQVGQIVSSSKDASELTAQIFPNPANEFLWVDFDAVVSSSLRGVVYNGVGVPEMEFVVQEGAESFEIPLSALSSGLYFLSLEGKEIRRVWRFVKG